MRKILIVDDSETIRLDVRRTLSKAGFSVLEGRDGLDGLAIAAEHPDLALLILDVNMPVMNGLEMLERLKKDPKTTDIPVLLMTTESEMRMIARAKAAGAKAWFVKPVHSDMLLKATARLAR